MGCVPCSHCCCSQVAQIVCARSLFLVAIVRNKHSIEVCSGGVLHCYSCPGKGSSKADSCCCSAQMITSRMRFMSSQLEAPRASSGSAPPWPTRATLASGSVPPAMASSTSRQVTAVNFPSYECHVAVMLVYLIGTSA